MKKRIPIDATMIAQLKALQGSQPLSRFAKILGLSLPTVANALAGQSILPGSRLMLSTKILELMGANVGTNAA